MSCLQYIGCTMLYASGVLIAIWIYYVSGFIIIIEQKVIKAEKNYTIGCGNDHTSNLFLSTTKYGQVLFVANIY